MDDRPVERASVPMLGKTVQDIAESYGLAGVEEESDVPGQDVRRSGLECEARQRPGDPDPRVGVNPTETLPSSTHTHTQSPTSR